jgi:hypothetical protein
MDKSKIILLCSSLFFFTAAMAQVAKVAKTAKDVKEVKEIKETQDVVAPKPAPTTYPVMEVSTDEIDIMIDNMKYKEAGDKLKKNITQAKRRRKDTSVMDAQLERCNRGVQALRGTDHVVVVDSVVVDKQTFLAAYNISDEMGKVAMTNKGRTTEFTTQLGNKVYASEPDKESLQLYTYYLENGRRTEKKLVEGLDVDGDINYPFLMSDGSTLYFAARSSEGLGNYDLYITRYDYDEDKYYRAESLGFPYNSYANDYMMVVDEDRHIGWFASDRYQPEGKVCIYTFIPNSSRHPYDYENDPLAEIITAAKLRPVKATWTKENEAARQQALMTLKKASQSDKQQTNYEFTLVINDQKTYHFYRDFRSPQAKLQCKEWVDKSAQLKEVGKKLQTQRDSYRKSKGNKEQLLKLEQQYERLLQETAEAEKLTRNLELQ